MKPLGQQIGVGGVGNYYNSQNSEMKICEKYEVDELKIIIIIS